MENELMDQFLENRQSYMMDNNSIQQLNVASAGGDGVVGGVQAEVVSGVAGEILGGKYDEHREEHDVGDDDELKYTEEVQQSEKQQQQQLQTLKNFGLDDDGTFESNELAERDSGNNAAHEFGNGIGGFVFGGDHHSLEQQQQHDLFNMGNGHGTNGHDIVNISDDFGTLVSTGFEEKLNVMESELDCFKNEGEFSSISTVTEVADGFVPQIDVKIETKIEQHEMVDEEEPSSLATNTTNGTSSLSENIPPQVNIDSQINTIDDLLTNLEDKENSDPHISQRPNDLDLEQAQSQLNPDAKEFVPNFGSNPASPTSPFATEALQTEPVLSEIMETQMYFGQAPIVAPRHLLEDDDFVAQSPCKGKNDNDMDTVSVPRLLSEFELEADKRPHELEPEVIEGFAQRDEVMTPDQAIQPLPLDDVETQDKGNQVSTDSADYQPSNFIDHGPETCVDLDTDVDMPQSPALPSLPADDDVMKRSMYVTSDDPIEDVLNSVQPIPTEIDSVNNSFIEESATESAAVQLAGDKELLQVEEKEHVSNSPSTEEIQMDLQNNLNFSNKDIPQIPIDMQESLLVEQHELDPLSDREQNEKLSYATPFATEEMIDQRQPITSEEIEIEKQPIFEIESKPDNAAQFDNPNLFEEEQFKEEKCEIDKNQHIEEPSEDQNHYDQLIVKDQVEIAQTNELTEDSPLLTTNTDSLTGAENFLEQQIEVNESYSPFKITDDASNTMTVLESLNNETPDNLQQPDLSNTHAFESLDNESSASQQQADFIDVDMTPSFTANEKHLLEETKEQPLVEETKEQQLFSVSGLEQQMSELMLNNTDGNLSQAEEIAGTTATSVIEDISENLVNTDEAIDLEEQYQHHPEHGKTEHFTLVDDSFNRHELECLEQYQVEQKEQEIFVETEIKSNLIVESLENSTVAQQHQAELESEIVAVEEPIIEAEQTTILLAHEETEIKTEEKPELSVCMVPTEAEPAEVLEAITTTNTETEPAIEIVKKQEELSEEVKTDIVKEPELEELKEHTVEAFKEDDVVTQKISQEVPQEVATVAAAAAVATAAAVASKVASSPTAKKPLTKVTPTATAKSKVAPTTAAKKPAEAAAKKPIGLAAKPRAVPAKPASVTADKKTATTTANRKPITTSKVVAKTTTTTSTARTLTAAPKTTTTTSTKPTTATTRTVPSSTLTARKPATTNGSLTKPRAASAPTKPTTLGLSATNGAPKTKPISPRPTLTSQVRKSNPPTTLASRTKTTTSTTSSTAGTAAKTFTARPAPKFNISSSAATTTTTTKRLATTGSTTSSTTTTTLKASSAPLRKSTPTKPVASKTSTKLTPTAGGLKSKSSATKAASPAAKPAPIRKPVDKTIIASTNGEASADKQLNGLTEEQLNGDMQAVQHEKQQNGDSSIPMQTENLEQPFLETRYEKLPTDLINA